MKKYKGPTQVANSKKQNMHQILQKNSIYKMLDYVEQKVEMMNDD